MFVDIASLLSEAMIQLAITRKFTDHNIAANTMRAADKAWGGNGDLERILGYQARYTYVHNWPLTVTFPSHVTSASAIEKGKWLEWRDAPERTDSSGSNGPVEPDLDLDEEESFMIGCLVSADVIEHETDQAPDYGAYGVMSGHLALS
jgi:hypothetical protein